MLEGLSDREQQQYRAEQAEPTEEQRFRCRVGAECCACLRISIATTYPSIDVRCAYDLKPSTTIS